MAKHIQAIRGMKDILPQHTPLWQFLEGTVSRVLSSYGYAEVRMPILELTELFKRSIGEVTDIVEKEMYTFEDRNGDSLTLRPEGTAGCVRAGLEHGLLFNQVQRLWYQGPMFRHERPQKGRYRQFHQIGVESFGLEGPDVDLEQILITARIWRELGLENLELQINSLGTSNERQRYREELVSYFQDRYEELDEDSRRRLQSNPLRILDTKNPDMESLVAEAPTLVEHLQDESRAHFEQLCAGLASAGLPYVINPRLVRGLDYYARTVFEWVSDQLGAQGTVCAGGRYDGLVEQLGGKKVPAVGFAMGLERLISLLEQSDLATRLPGIDLYMVMLGEQARKEGVLLGERLRDALPQLRMVTHCGGGSFKSQFKKADKSEARFALILGDDELARGEVGLKPLREDGAQQQVKLTELEAVLAARL